MGQDPVSMETEGVGLKDKEQEGCIELFLEIRKGGREWEMLHILASPVVAGVIYSSVVCIAQTHLIAASFLSKQHIKGFAFGLCHMFCASLNRINALLCCEEAETLI